MKMQYKSVLFWFLIVATLWHCIRGVSGLYFPGNTSESLPLSTVITASSTCQTSGTNYNCNYCGTRRAWPAHTAVLTGIDSSSTGCSTSVNEVTPAPTNNGILTIDKDSVNCTFQQTVTSVNNKGYTLSFWLKYSCNSCQLFTFSSGGTTVNVSISNGGRSLTLEHNIDGIFITINRTDTIWRHFALRFLESSMGLHIDGKYFDTFTKSWFPSFNVTGTIDFNSYSLLDPTDKVIFLDFLFYEEALTDREIEYLSNITPVLDFSKPPFDCRCPPTHPILQHLFCTKRSSGNPVSLLQIETHLPVFTIDNNPVTSWVTGPTEQAWILLTMNQKYQIDGITIEVNDTVPSFVTIQLSTSTTTQPKETVNPSRGVNSITWSAGSTDEIQTRSDLIRRLASSINISMTGHLDSSDVYSVVEIRVNRRENCFGNAEVVVSEDSGCYCLPKTNTAGQDCGTCEAGYYRSPDQLDCPFMCNCTSAPGIKTEGQCNQVGGGCLCKDNVQGYHCDSCKHLYYNLTQSNVDGCMLCSNCDQTGSQSCDDVGTCQCKNNVINPQCNQCKANTYGFTNPDFDGCQDCACNTQGSDPNVAECEKVNGNCTCKQYVTGRKCDLCKPGYKNLEFSNSRGCDDCRCNKVGSQDIRVCNPTSGQCLCQYTVPNNLQCNPMFDSETLEPAFGPLAGGTEVTIKGRFFKQNDTQVKILVKGQNEFLTVKRFEEQRLQFVTSSVSDSGLYNIEVQWPKSVGLVGEDFSKTFSFTFKVNPQVTEPMNATVYRSGGCYVKIKGSNFESVSEARLIAHVGSTQVSDKRCINIGATLLNCPSPDLRNYTSVSTVSYGLQLDGIDIYRNLGNTFPGARLTVVDDPTVDTNSDLAIDNIFSNTLVIKGSNLDKACENSFEIKLGDDVCPIVSKTSTEVKCAPVIVFPGESKDVELKVFIGNFQSTVGKVKIKSFWATWQFIVIAASIGGGILLIIVIIIIVKCCRRCGTNNFKNRENSTSTQKIDPFDNIQPTVVAEPPANPARRNNYTDMSGIPLETIETEESTVEKFLHKLDSTLRDEVNSSLSKRSVIEPGIRCTQKGAEIRLIDGKFKEGPFIGQNATIKTLVAEFKDFDTDLLPRWIGTGLAETLRFRDCYQDNIHRSCGITIDESRFYVLYPATQRILKEHLRDKKQEFTSFSLIEICQSIAEAMDYLSSNGIVHRDIATRNCVVCSGDQVKISDAAFSWSLFPDEYMYDSERERWLPVRWMAQDSLQSGFYNTATDVWSYGILMWEVMSRGVLLPYFDIENNEDIKDHVISGFRLGKPETVPDDMYALMMSCWETNHNKRPAFVRIIERLIDILHPPESPLTMYENQQQDEELPEYGNIPDDRPKLPSRANMPARNGNVSYT